QEEGLLLVHLRNGDGATCLVLNYDMQAAAVRLPEGAWDRLLDSSSGRWGGSGESAPSSIAGGEELLVPPRSGLLYRLRKGAGPA
ncbi:MAG TPA: hypothetical protein VNX25_08565, partial [Verrucomicrobiae bacterium]|nr:hypothetical protein [Verrucomicrobiae bacterium]